MRIKSIYINNLRGIDDFTLNDFSSNTLIIGKNDSGKTNLCYAIRKVLDFEIRKTEFNEADSTNSNKKSITIRLVISIDGISDENRSILGTLVDRDNTVTIELISTFNEEISQYEERLFFGTDDKKDFPTNRTTPVDRIIDVIYVNPNYDLYDDKNQFFKFRSSEDKENDTGLTTKVAEEVQKLNEVISSEQIVIDINTSLNDQTGFQDVFDGIKFKTQSSMNPTNIYRSLDIIPYDESNPHYNNIGDGKNKTLSLLLKNISRKINKQRLLIVEEPENHLFPQYQRTYSKLIDSLRFDQILITTHSPTIIDFNKTKTIVKLYKAAKAIKHRSLNFAQNDYIQYGFMLNEEFSQMLFFDQVLLVEGFSEKYFYNRLMIEDVQFLNFCTKNNFGIFAVGGIDFTPYKIFLNQLGINVYVKTDNDIFQVPRSSPTVYRYAGIERVLSYLDETSLEELKAILGVNSIDEKTFRFNEKSIKIPNIENNMDRIISLFSKHGVYLSKHNDGFEIDFLSFVNLNNQDNYDMLCKSKLKNLHSFIQENKIRLQVTDKNKDSVLVRFMNV